MHRTQIAAVRLSVTGKASRRSAAPAPAVYNPVPLTEDDYDFAAEVEREVVGERVARAAAAPADEPITVRAAVPFRGVPIPPPPPGFARPARTAHPVDCDFCAAGAPHPKGMV